MLCSADEVNATKRLNNESFSAIRFFGRFLTGCCRLVKHSSRYPMGLLFLRLPAREAQVLTLTAVGEDVLSATRHWLELSEIAHWIGRSKGGWCLVLGPDSRSVCKAWSLN